jgi:hypothetical protein
MLLNSYKVNYYHDTIGLKEKIKRGKELPDFVHGGRFIETKVSMASVNQVRNFTWDNYNI